MRILRPLNLFRASIAILELFYNRVRKDINSQTRKLFVSS